MEQRPGNGVPDPDEIAQLRARADAGDQNAAGRLGELLAKQGDLEGALRVLAEAYGRTSSTTRQLAELLAEEGDLEGAVSTWTFSDVVWQNPAGLRRGYLSTLNDEDRAEEEYCDPEDWAFMEGQKLTFMLAKRGDEAAIAKLQAQADRGFSEAVIQLRWLAEEDDHKGAG